MQDITISFDPEFDLSQSGFVAPSEGDFNGPDWVDTFNAAYERWQSRVESFKGDWLASASTIGEDNGFSVLVVVRQPQHATSTPTGDGDTWERVIWQMAHDATPFALSPIIEHKSDAGW